jgi:uncharacterized protein
MAKLPVSVADLLRRPGHQRPLALGAVVEGLELSTSAVPSGAELDLDLVLEAVGDTVVVTGKITAPWAGECRRCLRPVEGTVTAPVRELFERNPTEGETYRLAADHIDLEPMVRETVLLELPLAPVCRQDCAGLCTVCGGDLNQVACDCVDEVRDPRWAALDELRFDR